MNSAKRTAALRIRLTADEHRAITEAGEAAGLGVCTYARMVVVKAAGRKPAPPGRRKAHHVAAALARWTGALAQIGAAVNQLVQRHDDGAAKSSVDVAEIMTELRNLREAILAHDFSGDASP